MISRCKIKTKLFCVIFFCCDDFRLRWWPLSQLCLDKPSRAFFFFFFFFFSLMVFETTPIPKKCKSKKKAVGCTPFHSLGQKTKKIALCFFVRAAVLQKKKRRIIRSFSCFSSLLPFPSSATFSSQRRGRRRTKETKAPNTLSERCVVFPVGLGRRRAESFFEFLHGSEREVVVLRFLLGAT